MYIDALEQMTIEKKKGAYPDYIEGPRSNWAPTYKLSMTDQSYVEKKE